MLLSRELINPVWYTVAVCTSDRRGASTDADVFLTLHGAAGTSPRVKLPSQSEDFERGQRDVFRLELPPLGRLQKLSIGHNNKGVGPGWHLDQVWGDCHISTLLDCHSSHSAYSCLRLWWNRLTSWGE